MNTDDRAAHSQSRLGALTSGPMTAHPVEAYRALLAGMAEDHWRSRCPQCRSGHPCTRAQTVLGLLDFTA